MTLETLFWNVLAEKDGYPCRLLDGQREWYQNLDPAFRDRALCTSGARLVFLSEVPILRLSYEAVSFCRSCNVVDFYENGVHTGSVRLPDMQYQGNVVFERKTKGRAKIEIWLPNTCGLRITGFDFGDCQEVPKPNTRLLLLGDSIMQGICSYYPTCSVSNLICRELKVEMINQSVGGAGFFPEALEQIPADRVLVALGINDVFSGDSLEAVEYRVMGYFSRLRTMYPKQSISCITPIWTVRLEDPEKWNRFSRAEEIIRREAKQQSVRIIEGMPMVPHVRKFYNEDGIHPNDLGFAVYAMSLLKYLKE